MTDPAENLHKTKMRIIFKVMLSDVWYGEVGLSGVRYGAVR